MHRAVTTVFLVLLGAGALWFVTRSPEVPGLPRAVVVDPDTLDEHALRAAAREAGCAEGSALWFALLDRAHDDLEALRAVATCARRGSAGELVDEASTLLGESRFLRAVPQLLDELHLKDGIPILNRVDTERLDPGELVDLGRLQGELGDLPGAMRTLRQAITLDPGDGTARMLLGHDQVASGDLEGARQTFRDALQTGTAGWGLPAAYAAGLAWPWATMSMLLGLGGAFGVQGLIAARRAALPWERGVRRGFVGAVLAGCLLFAARYQGTGDPLAFVQLLAGASLMALWLIGVPLREPVVQGLTAVGQGLGRLVRGRFDRSLEGVPFPVQIALLLAGVVLLVAVAPAVPDVDLALGVVLLALALVFSTVGSLLLAALRTSASMRSSLWWLGFAGTLPFLGVFLYLERRTIIAPLQGQALDPAGVERVLGALLVWGVGAVLAVHLSRILSRSIVEPVEHVLHALEEVRRGNLDVDATLERRDEIGRLGEAVNGMADGIREQQRLTRTFRRYMDARIAQHLLDEDVERGRLVHAVVMFSDLRGFTSLSETMGPEQLVAVLNRYFGTIAPLVAAHGGVVDKYMGDGMLAVWGVPEPRAVDGFEGWTDERLAVQAAIAMVEAVRALSAELAMGELRIGIGLHCGEVVAGPMGSESHREYTVVGDTVNTAQRIEGQARGAHAVLMSGAVASRLGDAVPLDALEPVALKGKAEPLALWGVRPTG